MQRRITSVDTLRGVVMIIMALDHVRDFVHRGAMTDSPTNLATTTPILFLTRWITHICAPAFALTAGLGAWFWWQKGHTRAQLARFLVTRGLWLMLLEVTIMRFGYYFNWSLEYPVLLLVFWSLGLSMVVLAALAWLPTRVLGVLAVAGIVLHPLLDPITPGQFGGAAWLWNVLHDVGAFQAGSATVITPYPLIPWVAVMALGFALGPMFRMERAARRRQLMIMGTVCIVAFVVMRMINGYGDPAPWTTQDSPVMTALSFMNTNKYPASPAFLLMALGPAFLLLAAFDREQVGADRPATVVGRVPLFYFVVHFYLAHLIASLMAVFRYGSAAFDFLLLPYPSMGGPADRFPADFGWGLATTYMVWLVVLALIYPLCKRYAAFKASRSDWWLAYV